MTRYQQLVHELKERIFRPEDVHGDVSHPWNSRAFFMGIFTSHPILHCARVAGKQAKSLAQSQDAAEKWRRWAR